MKQFQSSAEPVSRAGERDMKSVSTSMGRALFLPTTGKCGGATGQPPILPSQGSRKHQASHAAGFLRAQEQGHVGLAGPGQLRKGWSL